MKLFSSLLVALAVAGAIAATPAEAREDHEAVTVRGPLFMGLDVKSMSGKGLMAGATMTAGFDNVESNINLHFYPQAFTKFFAGDVAMVLAPRIGELLDLDLPVEIQPMAGLEGGMYIDDFVAPTTGTSSGIGVSNAFIGVPFGGRVSAGVGQAVVSVEALYHYQIFDVLPGQMGYTTSRWHYEADGRVGSLVGGVYYDTGAFWSGPGVKLGLNF